MSHLPHGPAVDRPACRHEDSELRAFPLARMSGYEAFIQLSQDILNSSLLPGPDYLNLSFCDGASGPPDWQKIAALPGLTCSHLVGKASQRERYGGHVLSC